MAMVCPECERTYPQALQCPGCGVRLQYQAVPRRAALTGAGPAPAGQWQHTPWGRILVGLLLTQGLAYGLQMLCTAGLLATDAEATRTVWATLFGLVLLQALQGLSLCIGGGLTGAGQSRGLFLGALLGMAHTAVWMAAQQLRGERLTEINLYAQPVLNLTFGALGGHIGSLIWRPLPTVTTPLTAPAKPRESAAATRLRLLDGPIAWARVAAGVGIVLAGVLWPKVILDFVVNASAGQLSLTSHLQAQLITWEITGLITLFGGAWAGATTRNGLKQGLCVGVSGSFILTVIQMFNRQAVLEQTLFVAICTLCLTIAGSWFGGQLFPPIAPTRRRAALD